MLSEDQVRVVARRNRRSLRDLVAAHGILVQFDSETWLPRQPDLTVPKLEGLGQQFVDEGIAGPIDSHRQGMTFGGDQVHVGDEGHGVAPSVRSKPQADFAGPPGSPPRLGEAPAATAVGLHDLDGARGHQLGEALQAEFVLARSERDASPGSALVR